MDEIQKPSILSSLTQIIQDDAVLIRFSFLIMLFTYIGPKAVELIKALF